MPFAAHVPVLQDYRVVHKMSPSTRVLKILFSRIDNALCDVCSLISRLAFVQRLSDLTYRISVAFHLWRSQIRFVPRSSQAHRFSINGLDEYVEYGRAGTLFVRPLHSAGVKLFTFVPLDGKMTGVAWTNNRKALLFDYNAEIGRWSLSKRLNRQDNPFDTWVNHLGGRDAIRARQRRDSAIDETCASRALFRLSVIPFFGDDSLLISSGCLSQRTFIDSVDAAVTDIVRQASYMTVGANDPMRTEWTPFRTVV